MQQQYLDVHPSTRGLPVLRGITVGGGICLETLRLGRCWMRASRPTQRTPLRRALVSVEVQVQVHRKASYPQRLWHLLLFHLARVQRHKRLSPRSHLLLQQIYSSIRLLMFPQSLPECWNPTSLLRTAHLILPCPARLIPHYLAQQRISRYQAPLHPYLPRKVGFRLFQVFRLRMDQAQRGIHAVSRIQGVSVLLVQWATAANNRKPQ